MTELSVAYYTHASTAVGPLLIAGDRCSLMAIKFDVEVYQIAREVERLYDELRQRFVLERDDARMAGVVQQVVDYVEGKRTKFKLSLDLSFLTPFQQAVLLECARIPRGEIASYAELARRVGKPLAFRAVGNTMRINPIPIVIPCHRVVASDGIGGYGGGLAVKRQLLALEGVSI
ncbi:MAG: methylated-DNA--[protein]-cysteine S-methyltransferase [Dehalococcoidia bacterium]